MRSKIISYLIVATVVAQLGLGTGCAWWRKKFGPKQSGTAGAPGALSGTDLGTAGGGVGARPMIGDGQGLVHGQFTPVYFDYDSARIRPSEFSKLEAVAAALRGNNQKLVIEGHTDERGTAEYNRALGEKRAQSAQAALVSLGIAGSRISTISFGKDRPAEIGHDDTAWSRNRRCEFVLVTQ